MDFIHVRLRRQAVGMWSGLGVVPVLTKVRQQKSAFCANKVLHFLSNSDSRADNQVPKQVRQIEIWFRQEKAVFMGLSPVLCKYPLCQNKYEWQQLPINRVKEQTVSAIKWFCAEHSR